MTHDELVDLVRRLKPMGVSEIHVNDAGNFTIKLDPSYQPRAKRQKRSKAEHTLPVDSVNPGAWAPSVSLGVKPVGLGSAYELNEDEFNKTLFYST